MAWVTITKNPKWEYNNSPPDPGGAQHGLWLKQINGIRKSINGHEIYTCCRIKGKTIDTQGELNKTFWDNA
jgi:hypothetical protein